MKIRVFKFGGASLRNPAAIRNVAEIIRSQEDDLLLVVVSAMGKTTNDLEHLLELSMRRGPHLEFLHTILAYHREIADDLVPGDVALQTELQNMEAQIKANLLQPGEGDMIYDQVVSMGEVLSSKILHAYLSSKAINTTWVDARQYVKTDSTFREGRIDWETSLARIQKLRAEKGILLTQGFIGSDGHLTTTLGREGSDFSAAIFASGLGAESVTIWKDVPGVMSADPKRLPDAITFEELPFKEAAEMTYYGASVIHPKTIKPLANRNIPLLVKNFDDPRLEGTRIHECKVDQLPPLIVVKENQCLISCRVTDYTFIDESQIGIIFQSLSSHGLKLNLMQNSAISFSFCVDFRESKVLSLVQDLSAHFEVYYNTGLTLTTVKNYDRITFEKYRQQKGIVLEQSSRSTLQVLTKS